MLLAVAFGIGSGVGTGQVHADQPVGAAACQSGQIQPFGFATWQNVGQGFFDRSRIQSAGPEARNLFAVAAVVQYLPCNDLALAVGIGGDDHYVRLGQQFLDNFKLLGRAFGYLHLPCLGNDRQRGGVAEIGILLAVGSGRHLAQDMAECPSNGGIALAEIAVVTPAQDTQHLADVFGLRRLFAEKEFHQAA